MEFVYAHRAGEFQARPGKHRVAIATTATLRLYLKDVARIQLAADFAAAAPGTWNGRRVVGRAWS